jgi:hypothetical protein
VTAAGQSALLLLVGLVLIAAAAVDGTAPRTAQFCRSGRGDYLAGASKT